MGVVFLPVVALGLFLAGTCLHLFFFRRGEHHMLAVRYISITIISWISLAAWLGVKLQLEPLTALLYSTASFSLVSAGTLTSLIVFRLFFHPLRHFPGPGLAKFSSLWYSTQVYRGDAHHKLVDLHHKYGPYVRIGSNDLSIADPAGVPAVYGPNTPCRKATWYDEDSPRRSIHTSRDFMFHKHRRRVWSPAFSDKALRGYEPRVARLNQSLIEQLSRTAGQPINVSEWFNWWSFDVMGDLAFNKDFGALQKGQSHFAIEMLNEAMHVQCLKLPTWIFRILVAVPGAATNYWKFIGYCDSQLTARMQEEPKLPDIMSTLIPAVKPNDPVHGMHTLQADSRTIIVAGSDTTASTLAHVFYEFAKNPGEVDKLRAELNPLLEPGEPVENQRIYKADHLNAIINEALRLHPVPPAGINRKTPPEGIHIGEKFIPGDVTVCCPQYVLGRSEDCFEAADKFVPERWYSRPEMIKQKDAYAPFSSGVYGCIGKPLALVQLRTVITEIVRKFDVSFPAGEDGSKFIAETKDQFTFHLADLPLVFRPRQTV